LHCGPTLLIERQSAPAARRFRNSRKRLQAVATDRQARSAGQQLVAQPATRAQGNASQRIASYIEPGGGTAYILCAKI